MATGTLVPITEAPIGVVLELPKDTPVTTSSWSVAAPLAAPRKVLAEYTYKYSSLWYLQGSELVNGKIARTALYIDPKAKVAVLEDDDSIHKAFLADARNNLQAILSAYKPGISLDPEFFVVDGEGKILPAFEFLDDEKTVTEAVRTAHKSLVDARSYAPYWDGFQAEFKAGHGDTCIAYTGDDVQLQLDRILKAARKKCPTAKLSASTLIELPLDVLATTDYRHVQLGCAPSKNAYDVRPRIPDGRDLPFRSTGGHIHFCDGGIGTPKQEQQIVKALDATLGIASVSMFASFDSPIRRQFYGLAGEYRRPAWGIEYRVLSNAWLFHPAIFHLTLDMARRCYTFGKRNFRQLIDATDEQVQAIINNCDVAQARKHIQKYKPIYESLVGSAYYQATPDTDIVKNALRVLLNGIEVAVKDPTDIENNWLLKGGWANHSEAPNCQWHKLSSNMAPSATA